MLITATPIGQCSSLFRIFSYLLILALPASEFLLFLYVRAIYIENRLVVWFFLMVWVFTVVSTVLASIGIPGTLAGLDTYCMSISFSTFCTATIFIPFAKDTLIFVALTWRILRKSYKELTVKNTILTITLGKNIPYFSRALLQKGQSYIL